MIGKVAKSRVSFSRLPRRFRPDRCLRRLYAKFLGICRVEAAGHGRAMLNRSENDNRRRKTFSEFIRSRGSARNAEAIFQDNERRRKQPNKHNTNERPVKGSSWKHRRVSVTWRIVITLPPRMPFSRWPVHVNRGHVEKTSCIFPFEPREKFTNTPLRFGCARSVRESREMRRIVFFVLSRVHLLRLLNIILE